MLKSGFQNIICRVVFIFIFSFLVFFFFKYIDLMCEMIISFEGPGWLNELGIWITQQLIQAYNQYGVGSRPALYIAKENALNSQPQVITFTSWLPMVGGTLRVLRSLPPLTLVVLKVALKHQISINQINVRFVDIGGIVDHHCLDFLFIIYDILPQLL